MVGGGVGSRGSSVGGGTGSGSDNLGEVGDGGADDGGEGDNNLTKKSLIRCPRPLLCCGGAASTGGYGRKKIQPFK